jgi:nucleotide-binding universal stress UspA family protein
VTGRPPRLLVVVERTDGDALPSAVHHAAAIASRSAGRLRLLHVVDVRSLGPDVVWVDPNLLSRALCDLATRQLDRMAARLRAGGVSAEAAVHPVAGGVTATIACEARQWGSDLVVLHQPRRRPPSPLLGGLALLAALLLGAVTGPVSPQALVEAGAPPVLLVPELLPEIDPGATPN